MVVSFYYFAGLIYEKKCITLLFRRRKGMKKIFIMLFVVVSLFLYSDQVAAADVQVFDSTNNYLGACQFTDTSEWILEKDLKVTTFQVWYSWNQGETELPVTVYRDSEVFAEFAATRSSCDPYQKQWCNAYFAVNKIFSKGTYSTKIPNARQCLKPGGTGAIRLYEADVSTASPAATQEEKIPVQTQPSRVEDMPKVIDCPGTYSSDYVFQKVVLTAIVTFLITSGLCYVLFKKRKPNG